MSTNLYGSSVYAVSNDNTQISKMNYEGIELTADGITVSISPAGLNTTNPDGIQMACDLDMNTNNITNTKDIYCETLHYINLDPSISGTQSLEDTLGFGNSAGTYNIDMSGNNIIKINSLNSDNNLNINAITSLNITTPNVNNGLSEYNWVDGDKKNLINAGIIVISDSSFNTSINLLPEYGISVTDTTDVSIYPITKATLMNQDGISMSNDFDASSNPIIGVKLTPDLNTLVLTELISNNNPIFKITDNTNSLSLSSTLIHFSDEINITDNINSINNDIQKNLQIITPNQLNLLVGSPGGDNVINIQSDTNIKGGLNGSGYLQILNEFGQLLLRGDYVKTTSTNNIDLESTNGNISLLASTTSIIGRINLNSPAYLSNEPLQSDISHIIPSTQWVETYVSNHTLSGPTGPTGLQGSPGLSSSLFNYKAETVLTSPPIASGYIEWNTNSQTSASIIYVSHIDNNNNDVEVLLGSLNSNNVLIIQDKTNSNNYQKWSITGVSVVTNSYITYNVSLIISTHSFSNNNEVLLIVQSVGTQGPTGNTGPTGITGSIGPTGPTGIAIQSLAQTLLIGNSAGSTGINMNGNNINNVNFINGTQNSNLTMGVTGNSSNVNINGGDKISLIAYGNSGDNIYLNATNGNTTFSSANTTLMAAAGEVIINSNNENITLNAYTRGILLNGGDGTLYGLDSNNITLTTQDGTLSGGHIGNIKLNSAGSILETSQLVSLVDGINTTHINLDMRTLIDQVPTIEFEKDSLFAFIYKNNDMYITTDQGLQITSDKQLTITSNFDSIDLYAVNGNVNVNSNLNMNTYDITSANSITSTNFYGVLNGNATSANTATNATNATNVAIADDTTSAIFYPVFVSNNTGNLPLKVDKTTNPLSYNPSSGNLTATTFTGALAGNATTATTAANTGMVYLQTLTGTITGVAGATTYTLPSIFTTVYKNYKIHFTFGENTFTAYPSVNLNGFSGTNVPTVGDIYGYDMTSGVLTAINLATQTLSTSPLQLTGACLPNCQLEFDVFNVGYTTLQSNNIIRIVCNSTFNNPGVKGIKNITVMINQNSSSTITGLSLQSVLGAGNNPTWTAKIYGYK